MKLSILNALPDRLKSLPRTASVLISIWVVFLAVAGTYFLIRYLATLATSSVASAPEEANEDFGDAVKIPRWAKQLTPPPPLVWSPDEPEVSPWTAYKILHRVDLDNRLVSGGRLLVLHRVRIDAQGDKLPEPTQLAQITHLLTSDKHVHTRVLFFLPEMDPALSPWARAEFSYGEPIQVFSNATAETPAESSELAAPNSLRSTTRHGQ